MWPYPAANCTTSSSGPIGRLKLIEPQARMLLPVASRASSAIAVAAGIHAVNIRTSINNGTHRAPR